MPPKQSYQPEPDKAPPVQHPIMTVNLVRRRFQIDIHAREYTYTVFASFLLAADAPLPDLIIRQDDGEPVELRVLDEQGNWWSFNWDYVWFYALRELEPSLEDPPWPPAPITH